MVKLLAVVLQPPARINGRCYHKAVLLLAPRYKALVSVEQSTARSGLSQCFGEQLGRSCRDHLGRCSWYVQVSPVKENGSFEHCRVSCSEITPGVNAL